HYTPVTMGKIKNNDSTKCCRGSKEIGSLIHHTSWEYKIVYSLWKIVWQFLTTLKMQLPDDLAVTLLGIYAREVEMMFTQNLYTDVCNIFIPNSSKLETTEMSFRQTVVSPDHGILLSNEGD
ncbi:LORF2 protein, partial [Crocuta crocuta]